jgi:hypothetical protein
MRYAKTLIAAAAVLVEALQVWAAGGELNWLTVVLALLGVFGVWATPNKPGPVNDQ